jgi:hypothetical protein
VSAMASSYGSQRGGSVGGRSVKVADKIQTLIHLEFCRCDVSGILIDRHISATTRYKNQRNSILLLAASASMHSSHQTGTLRLWLIVD